MSKVWFIEARRLLSELYVASNATESARSLMSRKKVKAIYSEIFFLDQECLSARKEYEFIKKERKDTAEEIYHCVKEIKELEEIKRRSLGSQERLDRKIRELEELRKTQLYNNKILRLWRNNSPIRGVSKS